MSRSSYAYQPNTQKDALVIQALLAVSEQYPRYGFKKLFIQLRKKGFTWNHKRVHRVYCLLKLNIKRKGKKRLPSREAKVLVKPETVNTTWSADFMSDSLVCGRRFRTFNVIDDYNREILAIEIDLSFPAQRVIQVLDNIVAVIGYPHKIRLDNGPEFISLALADWAFEHNIELEFIQPGKPTQNAFIERFNRTFRESVLDYYLFNNLKEVREITEVWINEYNHERPHESLGNLSPIEYKIMNSKSGDNSTYPWH